jgi:hypothetical protein
MGFFFVHYWIVSAVKRIEFVSDGMSYIVLRVFWYNIVLNVHVQYQVSRKVKIQKTVLLRN